MQAGKNGASEFQGAHPRVVGQKNKYKNQFEQEEVQVPQNIMFDRRVFRGSTNAAMVIPSGSYPDQLFRANKKKYDPKALEQKRAQAAEEFFTRDVKTPEAPTGKQNIDIQTDQFVTELTDKAPMYEIACQTGFNIPTVKTPWAMPQLRGVSKKTLVEDNEIFLFDDEVEPLLSVLCGKTLEQARMEVLEEEELAEMKRKQAQLENLNKLEGADIKRLEEEEAFRLKTHEAKKNLQRQKKATQKMAHEKMVSRTVAKLYTQNMKQNAYRQLADVGFFFNRFTEVTLKTDVLPWLFSQTESYLKELNSFESLPTELIGEFVGDISSQHTLTITAHNEKRDNAIKLSQEQEEARIAAKNQRRQDREAARRAEELDKLRNQIDTEFIKKAKTEEGIVFQDIVDIDGHGAKNKPVISVIGGFLGQLILVLNTVAKHYHRLDLPSKSRASSRHKDSKPDTTRPKSGVSTGSPTDQPEEQQHQILAAAKIQKFIYDYILEKLKVEKLSIQVDPIFEQFLKNLSVPLELGQMRTMKEPNYSNFRELIRQKAGGIVLNLIRDNQQFLELEPGIFDLVFEGFWDLYTFRSHVQELTAKKLLAWIPKIKLVVNESTGTPATSGATDEEGAATEGQPGAQAYDPISAVVRIRIAKRFPDPVEDEEGNMQQVQVNEDELEEMPIDDKCLSITTNTDGQNIFCINQAAGRVFRTELIKEMSQNIDALRGLDISEFCEHMEKEQNNFENKFLQLFDSSSESKAPKVPVFDFKPTI